MAAGGDATSRSLQETPTWALATVCFFFIFLGIFIEHLIHLLGQWLKKHRQNALFEAVEKLKSVLMLLGFMSLILAVTQRPLAKICIPKSVANSMLPCRNKISTKTTKHWVAFEDDFHPGRRLAEDSATDHCTAKDMVPLISGEGANELSLFIFVLAVMQIVYSVATMALGRAKMRRWKAWEKETQTVEYKAANDPNRFRFTRQTTFGRRHMKPMMTSSPILLWIKCFFRQFFHSVAKVDYLTLRHGFIAAHLSRNNSFNFQKYIQRSLEEDFKAVVGISPFMWFLVVIFLLVDVHGWQVYLWVSFLPLIIVLTLGTKLEVIVAKMAIQLQDHNSVIKGTPVVKPNDDLFWFGHPEFVLTLLHYTLFMNAFELAFFVWVTVQFSFHSCYHEHLDIIIIRVVLAVTVQVVCSYITLPLHALVTQMGSRFKSTAVLEEQTVHVMKKWHEEVRRKRRKQQRPYIFSLSTSRRRRERGDDDDSSSSWSLSNRFFHSPSDFSSHRRTPTIADFATRSRSTGNLEMVDAIQSQHDAVEVDPRPRTSSSSIDEIVQIDVQEIRPATP
ncbi:hypothetical protein NMG60_11033859 [Bertholletia excelsa]